MAKRKITVTVDEDVLAQAQALGVGPSLSSVVNDALTAHVDRIARHAALGDLLAEWDATLGPVSEADAAAARAAFDELDATTSSRTDAA